MSPMDDSVCFVMHSLCRELRDGHDGGHPSGTVSMGRVWSISVEYGRTLLYNMLALLCDLGNGVAWGFLKQEER